ncbi:MAG: hypothetical protein WC322_02970 [Candidatus Paceibacterota bacterium]|jgi:hypothetical protein
MLTVEEAMTLDLEYQQMQAHANSWARAHCPECGRFARVVRGGWVYLGYGSEYRLTVKCAVHGLQDIY